MSRAAILVEEEIDPGAGSLQRTIRRRDVNLQQFHFIRSLGAFVDFDPNAGLLRNHFALSAVRAATWPISKLLWASLRAHMLYVPQNAIPAFLATEYR